MALCERQATRIMEGTIGSDHGRMYLPVPPKHSPSSVMKIPEEKSAERSRKEYPELEKRYWGMQIRARGYVVSTVGTDNTVIQDYVKEQADE